MKYLLLFLLLCTFSAVTAQEKDSIPQLLSDSITNASQGRHPSEVDLLSRQHKIDDNLTYMYQKPRFVDLFNKIPRNIGKSAVEMVSKPNYSYGLAAIGTTVTIIPADPWLIRESGGFGESLGLNEAHTYKKLGFLKIVPADVNSALYLIGNGTTSIIINGRVATYGLITGGYRVKSTTVQVLESIVVSGAFVQPFKRFTGRGSPFITVNEGRWHSYWTFALSFKAYQQDTPRYDAMFSGHLTITMSAIIVIAESYPDYKRTKPVGYSALGLICFEMMQNKVYWASDYPVALFVGYITGKTIANRRITKRHTEESNALVKPKYQWQFSSSYTLESYQLVGARLSF